MKELIEHPTYICVVHRKPLVLKGTNPWQREWTCRENLKNFRKLKCLGTTIIEEIK